MNTSQSLSEEHKNLVEQVQHNCDISDANHAGNYTLCIYLLKMREYYRWIHALDFADNLDNEGMSQWLRTKEDTWDQVIEESFKPIDLASNQYDPFDAAGINSHLIENGLFYHAGIGQKAVQHFFVADLADHYSESGIQISVTAREYARDLTAPPALSTEDEIIVRQESLRRMCWERYQEWNWNRYQNPMGTALSFYPFEDSIPEALQQMVEAEQNTLIQHELGEMAISGDYATRWSSMMLRIMGTKAELLARAVRDHLADCLYTLPYLIEQDNPASLHFFFANLTYIRKDLFPSAIEAYQHWIEHGKTSALADLAQKSALHWDETIRAMLAIDAKCTQNPGPELIALIENSRC